MKQGHLFIVFLLIAGNCFLSLYCVQKHYDSVIWEKQQLENALLEVAEDTGNRSKPALCQTEEKKKQVIEEAFSEAMSVYMGEFEASENKEFWRMYIPMLLWVEEDGAIFYYLGSDNDKEFHHTWTEKKYFYFPDGCNEKKKKAIMAAALEQTASEIITNHNFIAGQYGISYHYYLPTFFQDMSCLPEFPMLFIVLQGWPINGSGIKFSACIDAGVYLREKEDSLTAYPRVIQEEKGNRKHIKINNIRNILN